MSASQAKQVEVEPKRTLKSSKSRSGCRQCKIKRMKCDEARPECRNCVQRGVACPGYEKIYKWDAKRQFNAHAFSAGGVKVQSTVPPGQSQSTPKQALPSVTETINQHSNSPHVNCSEAFKSSLNVQEDSINAFLAKPNDHNSTSYSQIIDLDGLSVEEAVSINRESSNAVVLNHVQGGRSLSSQLSYLTSTGNQSHGLYQRRQNARRLLSNFYGSSPMINAPLVNHGTRLVEYYFSTICRLYSCFDSSLNPFRFSVAQVWTYSAATYYAIQSMAAAYLANSNPQMRKQGLVLHQKAADHLTEEMQICQPQGLELEKPLLTLLLLGMSACWQRSEDLGLPYLRTARRLMVSSLIEQSCGFSTPKSTVVSFFEEALVYWEMIAAFVTDDPSSSSATSTYQAYAPIAEEVDNFDINTNTTSEVQYTRQPDKPLVPHAWTGVSPEAQMLLAEVGRLLRRVRRHRPNDPTQPNASATALEEKLLELELPPLDAVTPCGDLQTATNDFITLAQITRDCGLLELYRVFPGVLRNRLGHRTTSTSTTTQLPPTTLCEATRSWLAAFAIRILNLLNTIPSSSSVRVHQLLPLLLAACELHIPLHDAEVAMDVSSVDAQVHWARQFTRDRLEQLAIQLPARPIRTMQKLLEEVWFRMDSSLVEYADDVFWMDVMVENGWETIMG